MLAGGIDGSVNPKLIPDSVAYRLFMLAMAEPAVATAEQAQRQKEKLSRFALAEPEFQSFTAILATYLENQRALEAAYAKRTDLSSVAQFEQAREALVSQARQQMSGALSPTTLAALDQVIQAEKRHMAIYPMPQMH